MPATTQAGPLRHDEAVIMVAGSPVRAYRAGAGPALVLLHGGGLDDAQLSWAPVWPALSGHAQLLAPDLPGYGGSPLGPTAPTLEGYRKWLLAFLDAAGLQQAVLAGLSLGGGIACAPRWTPRPGSALVLLALTGSARACRAARSATPPPTPTRCPGGPAALRPAAARQPARPAPPSQRGHRRPGPPGPRRAHPPRRRRRLVGLPAPRGGMGPAPHLPHRAACRNRLPQCCCCPGTATGSSRPATCAPRPPATPAPASPWSPAPATGCPATPPGRSPAS